MDILSANDYTTNPARKQNLVALLRKDTKTLGKINVQANAADAQIIDAFENYAAEFINKFQENFDIPRITGGSVKVDAVSGLLIASGPATGGIGYVLGATSLALQFLGSLNVNLYSRLSQSTKQKTGETALDALSDRRMQEAIAKEYDSLPKNQAPAAAGLERGKGSTLDRMGRIRTERSTAEVKDIQTRGMNLDAFKEQLGKIGLALQKDDKRRLYIEVLPTQVKSNLRMMVAPDIAVFDEASQRLYLRDPDNLSNLYINRHDRYYPYETSHGASKESLILISNNRFFSEKGEYQIRAESYSEA